MKTNDEALLKIKYNVLRTVSRLAFEGRLEAPEGVCFSIGKKVPTKGESL